MVGQEHTYICFEDKVLYSQARLYLSKADVLDGWAKPSLRIF